METVNNYTRTAGPCLASPMPLHAAPAFFKLGKIFFARTVIFSLT
jgi:hypothetical protein